MLLSVKCRKPRNLFKRSKKTISQQHMAQKSIVIFTFSNGPNVQMKNWLLNLQPRDLSEKFAFGKVRLIRVNWNAKKIILIIHIYKNASEKQ